MTKLNQLSTAYTNRVAALNTELKDVGTLLAKLVGAARFEFGGEASSDNATNGIVPVLRGEAAENVRKAIYIVDNSYGLELNVDAFADCSPRIRVDPDGRKLGAYLLRIDGGQPIEVAIGDEAKSAQRFVDALYDACLARAAAITSQAANWQQG